MQLLICPGLEKIGEVTTSPVSPPLALSPPSALSPKRGEARTNAILDTTIELLAEVGYDRITMDTVAARAKASKATIYRHWPDKTALVLDALRRRGPLVPNLADTGSLRGDLELYARETAAATAGTTGSLVVGLLAVASRDPDLGALLTHQFHDEQVPAIMAVIDRARERGEVGPDVDPWLLSEALPGILVMHLLILRLPADDAFIHRLVDDILIPLLTVAPPPAKPNRSSSHRRKR
jgi:AcrR family transcriptional regulator